MPLEAFSLDSGDEMAFKRVIRDVVCNMKNAKTFLDEENRLFTEEEAQCVWAVTTKCHKLGRL